MRRYFSIIISFLIILAVLIALSAAGSIEFDRPEESELQPIRSSYSTGPTGTRAFYQLLEESGKPVARWRESYLSLGEKAGDALLIAVGPFKSERSLSSDEALSLQKWIAAGGNALIVSRHPVAQFGDPLIHSEIPAYSPPWKVTPEMLIYRRSDELIAQPTELTKDLRGLALSQLAARITFKLPEKEILQTEEGKEGTAPETTSPPPSPEPTTEEEFDMLLYAPVVHIGDKDGAILADFKYGKGRLIFLSDPFVIANNGIAHGSNLTLALNLINTLSASEKNIVRRIFFDEFHHGYRNENNPLVTYFRGTPMPWLMVQGVLLSLLIIYSYGKRFARPLPLPQVDRHSPLEFVSSMANLQQVARARDLAVENIFPRFKAQLCRRLGLSSRAGAEEIIASLRRQRLPISEIEVRQALSEGDLVLKGEQLDDAHLVKLVARMRHIMGQLKS
ncbi:MAG: DUF4350 domain-containing protein [Acidobacteria bacterium]|nr:DUF4350 domain-containing protein [Acidobacteriota bacterium]